jgi:hypothetical protein
VFDFAGGRQKSPPAFFIHLFVAKRSGVTYPSRGGSLARGEFNRSASAISNSRVRLYKKICSEDGNPEMLDKFIIDL